MATQNDSMELRISNSGNVTQVTNRIPIVRLTRPDETAILARLLRNLNYLDHTGDAAFHDPHSPWRPRQGRKKGLGRNRATKRGTRSAKGKK